jgi:hypothetical protein
VRQTERVADGHRPVSDLEGVGVAELEGREGLLRGDPDDRDVGAGVAAHHLALVLMAVRELDDDGVGAVDHVVVGDDDAVFVDEEARAEALGLAAPAAARDEAARLDLLAERVDRDDAGVGLLRDGREAERPLADEGRGLGIRLREVGRGRLGGR